MDDRIRITVASPEALRDDANDFAMVMAFGPPDADTYGSLDWQDASGNLYAVASFLARPEWVQGTQSPLSRPTWDTEPYVINMAGAERAQATIVFWTPTMGGGAPQADPAALTALGGMDGTAALTAMGLERMQSEIDPQ